jgi:hypothetical protein
MNSPVTRYDLVTALFGVLHRHSVASQQSAVEVISPLDHSVRVFGIILSEQVKPILVAPLAITTGRRRPTVGDMWILTEAQGAALVRALRNGIAL